MDRHYSSRLNDDNAYRRDELVRKIEHAIEGLTLKELEAVAYDMFTKGYMDD